MKKNLFLYGAIGIILGFSSYMVYNKYYKKT